MTPGWKTSEGHVTAYMLVAGTVLEGAAVFLAALKDLRPELAWVPIALAAVGAALQVAIGLGYQRVRTALKTAALALLVALALPVRAADVPPPTSPPEGLSLEVGPTLPMVVYPLGGDQVEILPGAGVQASLSIPVFQKVLGGLRWNMLSPRVAVYGSLVKPGPAVFGRVSIAAGLCTLSSLICLDFGGTPFATGEANSPLFFAISVSTNILLGGGEAATFGRAPATAANALRF